MAQHYGVAVLPARVRKPRDKAKVENAVLQAERWILARLRNETFFSLAALNHAIRELLEKLNDRTRRDLGTSRRELYETLDRPRLRPLPKERYDFAAFKTVRVGCDYHVEYERHFYSVPYQLVSTELDLKATAHTVAVSHKGRWIARHVRARDPGHTTQPAHMPKSHRQWYDVTPVSLLEKARATGEATTQIVETLLETKRHPQQGFRACQGLLGLAKDYGEDRLESACQRALRLSSPSFTSVKSILRSGLDREALEAESPAPTRELEHGNLRGQAYYQQETLS